MWDCVLGMNSYLYVGYFLSFVSIINFVVLELFVSIILQDYSEFCDNPESSISLYTRDYKIFKRHWSNDIQNGSNHKIDKERLIELIASVGKELSFLDKFDRISVVGCITSMNIDMDSEGFFYFNDILFGVLKKKYTKKLERRGKYIMKIIRMEEFNTKKALAKIRDTYKANAANTVGAQQLFMSALMLRSIFKNWKKFVKRTKDPDVSVTPQFSEIENPGENSLELS